MRSAIVPLLMLLAIFVASVGGCFYFAGRFFEDLGMLMAADEQATGNLATQQDIQKAVKKLESKLPAEANYSEVRETAIRVESKKTTDEFQCAYAESVGADDVKVAADAYAEILAGNEALAVRSVNEIKNEFFKSHVLVWHLLPYFRDVRSVDIAETIAMQLTDEVARIQAFESLALAYASFGRQEAAHAILDRAGMEYAKWRERVTEPMDDSNALLRLPPTPPATKPPPDNSPVPSQLPDSTVNAGTRADTEASALQNGTLAVIFTGVVGFVFSCLFKPFLVSFGKVRGRTLAERLGMHDVADDMKK